MPIAILVVLWFFVGMFCGAKIEESAANRRAVKEGHAHYVANPDGNPTFVWHKPCSP